MLEPAVVRPSRVLGLLICVVSGSFAGFVVWQAQLSDQDPRQLLAAQWVLALGAFTAMIGWLASALVTVRNSVKQHTINTLLQSRLSMAYIERLRKVNDAFYPIGADLKPIEEKDFADPNMAESLAAMRYILNYFEFTAIAIQHGDLDESLMRESVRGMVRSLCVVGAQLIHRAQKVDAKNFEHLVALNARWQQKPRADWGALRFGVAGVLLGISAGVICLALLHALPVRTVPSSQVSGAAAPVMPASAAHAASAARAASANNAASAARGAASANASSPRRP